MDILVNIAGVKGEQDWEAVYDVNLVKILHIVDIHLFSERSPHGPRDCLGSDVSGERWQGGSSYIPLIHLWCHLPGFPNESLIFRVKKLDVYQQPFVT